jgi:serine/threonine protein kinase/DNA-binding response OmpR family regulator
MTTRLSREEFLQDLKDSGLFSPADLEKNVASEPGDGEALAQRLIAAGKLTRFQAAAVLQKRFEELVIGNYQVLDRLGAGGMGTVFKARHRRMKRVVALKLLSRKVAQSERFVQRFQREVEAVAQLSHPNIVMAYDADEAEAGHFLVMEFVDGRDLATEVQKRGPLPVAEAVDGITQAARALEYAHGQGIIHRDIKPANLLRDVSGVVKVADLGLARFNEHFERHEEMAALTQAGSIMGTVDFMPPEQALGLTTIDHRADIYSLGCTLHFLLTGEPPYKGPTIMAILLKHREGPIPLLRSARSDVPAALDELFRRMVAKKPEERPTVMSEVVRALETLTRQPPSPDVPSSQTIVPTPVLPAASPSQTILHAHAPPPETALADQTVDLPSADNAGTAKATVLLVEPSRTQQVIVRKYLQEIGFADVSAVASGEKALETARTAAPAVVISALHLADMTGVQLARKMWAEQGLSSLGFVLITSQADAEEAHLQGLAGKLVRLVKPFDAEKLAAALASVAGDRPNSAGPRVLIVDDSAAARKHVRAVLAGLGLSDITEAGDGAAAVALLKDQTFDLVVTDYNMPGLDGRELIEFIRCRSDIPKVPIVMTTTETDPDKLASVRQLGVSAIYDKSFRPEEVRVVVEKLRANEKN